MENRPTCGPWHDGAVTDIREAAARWARTWTEAWEAPENPKPLGMPLQSFLVAEAQRRIARVAAKDEGARRLSTYFVGQIVGSMTTVQPAARVVLDMVEEFIDAVERLDGLLAD